MSRQYLVIEPSVIQINDSRWYKQRLKCTNVTPDAYKEVFIRVNPSNGVELQSRNFSIQDFAAHEVRDIAFSVKLIGKQQSNISFRVYPDEMPPQSIKLSVVYLEPVKKIEVTTRYFLQELRKLTNSQLDDLCMEEAFALRDEIPNHLSLVDKTQRIVDFVIRRDKFQELHKALSFYLEADYKFYKQEIKFKQDDEQPIIQNRNSKDVKKIKLLIKQQCFKEEQLELLVDQQLLAGDDDEKFRLGKKIDKLDKELKDIKQQINALQN